MHSHFAWRNAGINNTPIIEQNQESDNETDLVLRTNGDNFLILSLNFFKDCSIFVLNLDSTVDNSQLPELFESSFTSIRTLGIKLSLIT